MRMSVGPFNRSRPKFRHILEVIVTYPPGQQIMAHTKPVAEPWLPKYRYMQSYVTVRVRSTPTFLSQYLLGPLHSHVCRLGSLS